MQQFLKRLERPVPGSGGRRITCLTAFVEDEASVPDVQPEASSSAFVVDGQDEPTVTSLVFMAESFLTVARPSGEASCQKKKEACGAERHLL